VPIKASSNPARRSAPCGPRLSGLRLLADVRLFRTRHESRGRLPRLQGRAGIDARTLPSISCKPSLAAQPRQVAGPARPAGRRGRPGSRHSRNGPVSKAHRPSGRPSGSRQQGPSRRPTRRASARRAGALAVAGTVQSRSATAGQKGTGLPAVDRRCEPRRAGLYQCVATGSRPATSSAVAHANRCGVELASAAHGDEAPFPVGCRAEATAGAIRVGR